MYIEGVVCESCSFSCGPDIPVTICPECGSTLNIRYDFEKMAREVKREELTGTGMDRYRGLLPLNNSPVSLGEGETPLIHSESIGKKLTGELYFKLDFMNPTGSFKDRGSVMTVSKACEWGVNSVADDSSGNAGASLAGYSARAGLDCTIYVPASTSGEKLVQIKSYGAELEEVPGPRERATERIQEDTSGTETYYSSHNLSPYFTEGMKTIAHEVSEWFEWNSPDHVVVPVGGGALLVGMYYGFRELERLGWIDSVPKIHAVQTKSCNPVVKAFSNSWDQTRPVEVSPTIAEGVHISNPDRGRGILNAIRNTGGQAVEVSEKAVKRSLEELARKEGIFAEPTSAVPVAALDVLNNLETFESGEIIMIPITGSGLKDAGAWQKA